MTEKALCNQLEKKRKRRPSKQQQWNIADFPTGKKEKKKERKPENNGIIH